MKAARHFIVHLDEHRWTYRLARLAFWVLIASLVLRFTLGSLMSSVCATDTLYGFLEISCSGFPLADVLDTVIYGFTNVALGAVVAIVLMYVAIDTAIRHALYSSDELCPAFVTQNIDGQMITYATQNTCVAAADIIRHTALGLIALAFIGLVLVYGLHIITRMRASS